MVFEVIIGRNKKEVEQHGTIGTILVGKQYVKMGQTTSLSNPVYLDIASSHVMFIVGKRGSGKCLHEDTLVTLNDGSLIKIKDLENNDNDIFSLDSNLKINPKCKSNFFMRPVNRLLEIKLRTGKVIKLTPEHPLLTVNGWTPAEKLILGSRIATPRKIEAFGEKALPENKIKILAYLIAEGHLGNGFVLFANTDSKIISDFYQAINEFDSNLKINDHGHGSYRVSQIKKRLQVTSSRNKSGQFSSGPKFSRSSIRTWLEELGLYGHKSRTKFIPSEVFQLPKYQLSLFLNRLFSCDGTIFKSSDTWQVSYSSASQELISQLQHLLLRFGIVPRVREKNNKFNGKSFLSYELEISGEFVNQFIQEIGFYGAKEERAAIALRESVKLTRNPNLDTIPKEIWSLYKPESWAELGRKLGYTHPKAMRESQFYSPSRQKLLQIARVEESELLEKLATSDIYWDEIVSLKSLEGEFIVYDLTVPETHNFIAGDVIVHNSYTMGAIAEGLADLPREIKQNISILLLDTMGIYWTMKYPNFQDAELLRNWNMEPKPLDVKIYTPEGFFYRYKEEGIPTDFPFSLRPRDVGPEDWCTTFNFDPNSAEGVLITKTVQELNHSEASYSMEELIAQVRKDTDSDKVVKSVVINELEKAKGWEIFSKEGTPLTDLVRGGQVTVLDVSPYATLASGWEIKSLVVGLICQSLFNQRMIVRKTEEFKTVDAAMHYFSKQTEEQLREPLVWLALDEAHELLPKEGKTAATRALITILREGRQPGLSLILASQQPGKIHTDVMTQSDIVISHHLTARMDVEALSMLTQSYMRQGLEREIDQLPRVNGAAVIFDDANERIFPVQMRPRFTWHGGGSPSAMPEKKDFFRSGLEKIKLL